MNIEVHIVDGPLDDCAAVWNVPDAGAQLSFDGVVRPLEAGRPIAGLHYQVYEPMASLMLRKLAKDVCGRFHLLALRVEHSRGEVLAGQCSFRLRVASTHRKEALEAMGQFIDRLKLDVPIWKKPIWKEGP